MKHKLLLLCLFSLSFLGIRAQTTKDEIFADIRKTAGVMYVYPFPDLVQTPAPAGYKPFYISHYGRHGSRYLTNESDYKWILDVFNEAKQANNLTPLGADVCKRLEKLYEMANNRAGELTSVGVGQLRMLAERMYKSYPEVFKKGNLMHVRSTTVVRCILSMDVFCERLKELNPALVIDRDAAKRDMDFLNYRSRASVSFVQQGPWKKDYQLFEAEHVHPERLLSSLFSDTAKVNEKYKANKVMSSLFTVAGGMQNLDTDMTFYDLFEKQELFDLFQCSNYQFYVSYGNSPLNNGMATGNQISLLKDFIDLAEKAVAENRTGADLRFGHDDVLAPFAGLLRIGACDTMVTDLSHVYKAWSNSEIAPMGANFQMTFYKKKGSDDILVKFSRNEKEVSIPIKTDRFPYYHWKDVDAFYRNILSSTKN